jgi:hypothetical protein
MYWTVCPSQLDQVDLGFFASGYKKAYNQKMMQPNIERLLLPTGFTNCVFSLNVLEHVFQLEKVMGELKQVLNHQKNS